MSTLFAVKQHKKSKRKKARNPNKYKGSRLFCFSLRQSRFTEPGLKEYPDFSPLPGMAEGLQTISGRGSVTRNWLTEIMTFLAFA